MLTLQQMVDYSLRGWKKHSYVTKETQILLAIVFG